MKNFVLGSAFTYLLLYSVGITYFFVKGGCLNVRGR